MTSSSLVLSKSTVGSCCASSCFNSSSSSAIACLSAFPASLFFLPWTFLSLQPSLASKLDKETQCAHLKNSSRSISSSSLMIYLMVLSNRGMITCSMAFTRRFVARITSSKMVNAVCSDASSTSVSRALAYTSFARRTCWPPRPRPVRLKSVTRILD